MFSEMDPAAAGLQGQARRNSIMMYGIARRQAERADMRPIEVKHGHMHAPEIVHPRSGRGGLPHLQFSHMKRMGEM